MISPININLHRQSEGCPVFDPCTTVRRFHDDRGRDIRIIYRGWSICPLGCFGVLWSMAITWKVMVEIDGVRR